MVMMKPKLPELKRLSPEELQSLLQRIKTGKTTHQDAEWVRQLAESLEFICEAAKRKDVRIKALLKQIMGIKSERTQKVKETLGAEKNGQDKETPGVKEESNSEASSLKKQSQKPQPDPGHPKPKGHGRNGADAYTGAERITIAHPQLCSGDKCPECFQGRVYCQKQPGVFIHITGSSPLQTTLYELEKLRCNLCGEIFQAQPPEGIAEKATGSKHYDETAKSMIALLRYGAGLPMYRLSELQSALGIPLPVSTQWDKIKELTGQLVPLHDEFLRQAAQGELFHHDDTGMKVLSLRQEIEKEQKTRKGKTRTGIFTTGILSVVNAKKIALFFTGRKHAGENMSDLLEARQEGLSPPLQMSDAKSGNTPKNIEVIESCCNTHARRNFVNVAEDFPDQCLYVITEVFGKIYHHDALARQKDLSPEERLEFHQNKSAPVMEAFYDWLNEQFDQRLVEPNSSLGKAIQYVLNHWEKLTRFLQIAGVPLDNNLCEQMLKKAILHRKNSLFYKTEAGARSGDFFMSLIHTCVLSGENPYHYLTQLQIHQAMVLKAPEKWFPWNYRGTIASLSLAGAA